MLSLIFMQNACRIFKTCSKQKKIMLSLESKANDMKVERPSQKLSCNKCETLE